MSITRREILSIPMLAAAQSVPAPTQFQLACMSLPYAPFPFLRALEGIRAADYRYIAWGTTHVDPAGNRAPLLDVSAPPQRARELNSLCRDHGLAPVIMFSMVNLEAPEAVDAYTRRIEQAAAAGIPFIIVFGKTEGGGHANVIRCLQQTGPLARKAGVTLVVKQHGGNTATGQHISRILREVAGEGVRMCYDAGNVLDYESADPLPDIAQCWRDIRAFAIKDHRNIPKDEDCGPGFGEIDHYKLLSTVMRTGLTMPLAFENIFEPLVPRPKDPASVDRLARRAREYIESVLRGLSATTANSPQA
ncbi:MAG: sugar phosphate isomerase/epimerase [Acidobacteriia bacterium]|nr:sugar phosphate isomerase/epimerase [Terriglobia bacterium]